MRGKSIILVLTGLIFGSLLGELLGNVPFLGWLQYGKELKFGTGVLDLYVIRLSFDFAFSCTIAALLGLIIAIAVYYAIR